MGNRYKTGIIYNRISQDQEVCLMQIKDATINDDRMVVLAPIERKIHGMVGFKMLHVIDEDDDYADFRKNHIYYIPKYDLYWKDGKGRTCPPATKDMDFSIWETWEFLLIDRQIAEMQINHDYVFNQLYHETNKYMDKRFGYNWNSFAYPVAIYVRMITILFEDVLLQKRFLERFLYGIR